MLEYKLPENRLAKEDFTVMMKLGRGINLGGYLSQCVHTEEHYRSFIGEEDIKRIAGWGLDHVRLPIDYEVLETEDGEKKPGGYQYVRNVISWCRKYDLNIILDLHKASGYDFNNAGDERKNNLFVTPELGKRFIRLWENIAEEFGNCDNVAFELLNEVAEEKYADSWNRLIRSTVESIRKIAGKTTIIYGGTLWNSAFTLKYLKKPEDDNIIFTFHLYEPLVFTHQKAYWVKNMDMERTVSYPESMEYYRRISSSLGIQGGPVQNSKCDVMGPDFIREIVSEAVKSAEKAGVSLYCGEFGVIDRAPVPDTLRWFEDVDKVFREFGIGCAVWTYKEKDFGLIGPHYDDIREKLIALWTGR